MPLNRALRRIAGVAGLAALCGAGAVRAEDTPPTEDWIGAVSVDRFTDASWRIAAGRAQGDRGSVFELRLSCRRDGDRRDIAAEIFVFGRAIPAARSGGCAGASIRSLPARSC